MVREVARYLQAYRLAHNPRVPRRLQEELDASLSDTLLYLIFFFLSWVVVYRGTVVCYGSTCRIHAPTPTTANLSNRNAFQRIIIVPISLNGNVLPLPSIVGSNLGDAFAEIFVN